MNHVRIMPDTERVPEIFLPFISSPDKLLHKDNSITDDLNCFDNIFMETLDTPADTVKFKVSVDEQPQLPRRSIPCR